MDFLKEGFLQVNIRQINEELKKVLNEWNEGEWSADNRVWWDTDENGKLRIVTKYFSQYGNPMGCSYSFCPEKNETKAQCIKIINAFKKEVGLPSYDCDKRITYDDLELYHIYV